MPSPSAWTAKGHGATTCSSTSIDHDASQIRFDGDAAEIGYWPDVGRAIERFRFHLLQSTRRNAPRFLPGALARGRGVASGTGYLPASPGRRQVPAWSIRS